MSRNTHPVDRHQHSREDVRAQESRYIRKRWRRNKTLYRSDQDGLTINIAKRSVRRALGADLIDQLKEALGQPGPVLFLHPEAMRRMTPELRREIQSAIGLRVASSGELASATSARDFTVDDHHSQREAAHPSRSRQKRTWRRSAEAELPAVVLPAVTPNVAPNAATE